MLTEVEMVVGAFPGFKFSPSEEQLIQFYLRNKFLGLHQLVEVIADIDITRFEPWDLPGKAVVQSGNEWFFCVHGRKYKNGSQSKRGTQSGYWKVTGCKRYIKSGSRVIGLKRILHFHKGRAPTALKTEWLMDEYYMAEFPEDQLVVCRLRKNSEISFNDNSDSELIRSMIVDTSTSLAAELQHTHSFEVHTSENVIDKGVSDGYTLADGCYNPSPMDSENYHQQIQDESSSSKYQEWHDADDCFRDIINVILSSCRDILYHHLHIFHQMISYMMILSV